MSKKYKKVYRDYNYTEYYSLVGILIGITSYAIGLKTCVIIAGIKKNKLIVKKNKKKHDKILSLVKSKLKSVDFLVFKALIDSNISHNEFVLLNKVLK